MKARLLRNGRWFYLAVALVASFVAGFLARERVFYSERLFEQSYVLARITRDAMLYRATPERIAERVEADLQTPVGFVRHGGEDVAVVFLPEETGFLGMGGFWMLYLKIGKDGRCDQAWMETRFGGFP